MTRNSRQSLRRFLRDTAGVTAVETALVMMIALVFIFGIVEGSSALWDWNRAHKATQMGARFAVVSQMVADDLAERDFTAEGVSSGEPVPLNLVVPNPIVCDEDDCDGANGHDPNAFQDIVDRMRVAFDKIEPENVEVEYEHIGLGFAGNPVGPDVSPAVTVRLTGMSFDFVTPIFGDTQWPMPDIEATLTGEDFGAVAAASP